MTEQPTVTGDGLILRPWAPGDAADLQREVQDSEVIRWLNIEMPYTIADATRFIENASQQWEQRQAAHFVIAHSETDHFLGYLGVLSLEDSMRIVEIVYWVAAGARSRGVATKAVGIVVPWVDEVIGPERIELGMVEGNAASAAVADGNGFELQAIIIGGATLGGHPADEWIYRLAR